jgi:GABA permease
VAVVAPVRRAERRLRVYRDSRRAAAGRRLDRTLDALRTRAFPHTEVFDDEPLAAARTSWRSRMSTRSSSRLIRRRNPAGFAREPSRQIRKVAGDRPVEHVVGDVTAKEGVNVLVVANETVLGEPLLERMRARAAEGPASFLIVSPQSDPARGDHAEAERRLRAALATLRSEGIDVHGQIAHPDPHTAAMEAVRDERTDEIIVSTFPGERSGWLRRDLVGRLRSDTGLPVDHVVVENAEVPA